MTHIMPESWRQGLAHLRHDLHEAIDRWWHRHSHGAPNETAIPVRRETPDYGDAPDWPLAFPSLLGPQLPSIDVEETDDEVVVIAELPGLEKDQFTVDISNERWLRIRGEKKQTSEKNTQGVYYKECHYGAFSRMVSLPCEVDADLAKATYKHGALRITLPKTHRAKSRYIQIEEDE